MARLIRTAVNLLLVVSLTMQPMVVCALPSSCSASGVAQFSCHGCGHCEVADPADSCGCCSAKRQESKSGCCNREQPEPKSHGGRLSDDTSDERPSSCCEDQGSELPSPQEAVENAGCTCLEAPDAPYAPVPRPPVNENRDLLPLALESVAIAGSTGQPVGRMAHGESASGAADHFAQIEFCVWRL